MLYYFKTPKDRAPAGFVPLENIEIRAIPEKLTFELKPEEGKAMKSARMTKAKNGGFLQGHHKAFLFRVEASASGADASRAELEQWVAAVKRHAVRQDVPASNRTTERSDRG